MDSFCKHYQVKIAILGGKNLCDQFVLEGFYLLAESFDECDYPTKWMNIVMKLASEGSESIENRFISAKGDKSCFSLFFCVEDREVYSRS